MKTLRGAVVLGLLVSFTGATWGQDPVEQGSKGRDRGVDRVVTPDGAGLIPRDPVKRPVFVPDGPTSGRIIVKFKDAVKARVDASGKLSSRSGRDLTAVEQVLQASGVQCRSAFDQKEDVLAELEARAAIQSSHAQPDLAGFMIIDGGGIGTATLLNQLDEVEFVEMEPEWVLAETTMGDPVGACCLPGGMCIDEITEAACTDMNNNGWYQGDGTTCDDGTCGGCCITITNPDMTTDVVCQEQFEAACTALMGMFNGDGIGCGFAEMCGGCCIQGICVAENLSEELCVLAGGSFLPYQYSDGDPPDTPPGNYACLNLELDDLCGELDCGYDDGAPDGNTVGDCFDINGSLFCTNNQCCDLICDIDPFCCDVNTIFPGRGTPTWDEWCVDHAELLCGAGAPDTLCQASTNDDCFTVHEMPGCNDPACCSAVCEQEPLCCATSWADFCVALAQETCPLQDDETPGIPPNFVAAQGYLTPLSYLEEYGFIPPEIAPALPLNSPDNTRRLDGYQGQGYDLQGLYDLGDFLLQHDEFEYAEENLTRGRSIRVGVIEFSAIVPGAIGIHQDPDVFGPDYEYRHFDLDVTVEPDQTVLITGIGNQDGNHGTACLGIIGAIDHDADGNVEPDGITPDESIAEERGMVGIAPECDLYFFPTVSVEEPGGRLLSAMAGALTIFEPGDVLSFSIGPAGCGTLASNPAEWTLLRLAADLGITCCLAAGNSCCNLDDAPQAGDGVRTDADCIIVGACYPGRPTLLEPGWNAHCRLSFSNFCNGCNDEAMVHVGAWGTAVATPGYGNLFFPNFDPNLAYTYAFGGTSAACPMIAGLTACIQGMAKMTFGLPLIPSQIRQIVSGAGFPQCGYLSPADPMPGSTVPCIGDFDPTAVKNQIGAVANIGFASAVGSGNGLLTQGFFDDGDPFVGDIWVVRGDKLIGNRLSVQVSDTMYLAVQSNYTLGGSSPADPGGGFGLPFGAPAMVQGPISDITYIANGEITDLLVMAQEQGTIPEFAEVVAEVQIPAAFTLLFCEFYSWDGSGWTFIDFSQIDTGGSCDPDQGGFDTCPDFELGNVGQLSRFLHPQTGEMLMRFWTFGFGSGNFGESDGAENPYVIRYDEIRMETGDGFGVTPNGG